MDPDVQRELKIRRRLENIFNKLHSEFADKKAYDDYLEQRETYILNLLFGEQIAETEAKIAEYQRLNGESIARNRAAKGKQGVRPELVMQAGQQGSANAGATVAEAGTTPAAPATPQAAPAYTPSMAAGMAASSKLPVPCAQFTELPDGTIQMTHPERPSAKAVAAASGWNARDALIKAFNESTSFWL